VKRLISTAFLIICSTAVTACDPGVHIAWQKRFDHSIDPSCIEKALKSVSSSVEGGTYVSDGYRGFPRGTTVTQFFYSGPGEGSYDLDVATLPNGWTNYWHGWSKLGTDIPADQRARVLPLLYKANRAVASMCSLSFDDIIPEQGDG